MKMQIQLANASSICVFAKLLLPAWEIDHRLKTKNNGVYGVEFRFNRFSNLRISACNSPLNGVKRE